MAIFNYDVKLTNDDLLVIGGPETVKVELGFGNKGDRGSLIFVGNGKPDSIDIGQTPNVFDLYINLKKDDSEYLMIYQYSYGLGSSEAQWEPLNKLIPNTYSGIEEIPFATNNYCTIPISSIVDPSYTGNTNSSNFSVQAILATPAGYPIASSIKTEIVQIDEKDHLKITFYAAEFNGTSWSNITETRTAHIHISVV
jgi:hypothetical protein